MYLHSRNTQGDFVAAVTAHRASFSGGLVHSFTGDLTELQQLLALDLYIGVNGCSLKTPENLEMVRAIPLDRIMLETDCPYCEIRPSHAAFSYVKTQFPSKKKERYDPTMMVKGRNEPCTIVQVLEATAAVKGVEAAELAEIAYQNACRLFNIPT
jgi:TatD DNase family protein